MPLRATRYPLGWWVGLSHSPLAVFMTDIFLFFLISFFRFCNQGRLEIEIRKTNRIRETVSRRRSQTSTVKHSRPIPNHLNGSRSSKIVDAHLRMSLRDVPCVSADSGKSPFRGRLQRRPLACEKLFWGYRGLAPMDWVWMNAC